MRLFFIIPYYLGVLDDSCHLMPIYRVLDNIMSDKYPIEGVKDSLSSKSKLCI
jgi:hypothetical protein